MTLTKQLNTLSQLNASLSTRNDTRVRIPCTFSLAHILLGYWECKLPPSKGFYATTYNKMIMVRDELKRIPIP